MRIDQVVVSASPGDAITNFALVLRQLLLPHARSDLFAYYYDERLVGDVVPLSDYGARPGARKDRDLLVLHVSIGEPAVADFVLNRSERLVIIYHNISPSEPFRPYDPGFADLLDAGRVELKRLRPRADLVLADSEYNACELRALGFDQVDVLPIVANVEDLRNTEADASLAERLRTQHEGPVILFVGQLLPHKRADYLIEAFHILSTYLIQEASLVLVGSHRLPGYAGALQSQIDELHLDRATLAGSVSGAMLAAYMRRADLFVTASEHEGFCVPLLEAMAFELPFQARRFTAIPETAGDAGLILDADDGPAVAAESWVHLLTDDTLRTSLVERGWRRLAAFDPEVTKQAWRQALLGLAGLG